MLTGPVPAEIGDLGALTNLWLKDNNLSGGLPNELDNLTNLERVRISGNRLHGLRACGAGYGRRRHRRHRPGGLRKRLLATHK